MIKRNDQREPEAIPYLRNMTGPEHAAFNEAFKTIEGDYKTICSIGEKLRAIEQNSHDRPPLASPDGHSPSVLPDSSESQSPWEICAALIRLENNEVLLCKRLSEHGVEYAVIDQSPTTSRYGKAAGHLDILQTSDNPSRVLDEYLRTERQTLELMASDITASLRIFMSERFPSQDVTRVVTAITRMCRNAARLGVSESQADPPTQRRGVGV